MEREWQDLMAVCRGEMSQQLENFADIIKGEHVICIVQDKYANNSELKSVLTNYKK
jgi:hypothetical protein